MTARGLVVDRVVTLVGNVGRRLRGDGRLPFFFLALPVVIMLLVGTIFGTGNKRLPVGVAYPHDDRLASDLVARLGQSARVKPRHVGGADAARRAVRRGRLSAAVLVPPGYGARVAGGGDAKVTVIVQPGRAESAQARLFVGAIVARANLDVAVARARQGATGASFDAALAAARRDAAPVPDFLAGDDDPESPFAYTAPSNLVLFAFITALVTSAGVVQSRQLGVTRRVLASPTPAAAVVVADLLAAFLIALFQASVMLAVGAVLFGVDFGPPLAVVAVLVVLSLVSAAAGSLLATFVRTPEQAINFGPPIGIALGMLGGCMWPLEGVGPVLNAVGHIGPHAWAMDALVRLIFDDGTLRTIAAPLAVLTAYAAALGVLATARLRGSVLRS